MMRFLILCGVLAWMSTQSPALRAQVLSDSIPILDYTEPTDYEIGGVTVTGADYADENALINIAGFRVGDKIRLPGGDIPRAIKSLWKLRLFTDVQIYQEKKIGDVVFLEIAVTERPRLSRYSYEGAKKSTHDDLNEAIGGFLTKGAIITEDTKQKAANAVRAYFVEKGYLDAEVAVREIEDDARINSVRLVFDVERNERVKIKDIVIVGNTVVKDKKLRKLLENTKEKRRLFSSSKFIKTDYTQDKKAIPAYYNTIGYRDARITGDSIYRNEKGELIVQINVDEGDQYYFRNISWKGNSIYEEAQLSTILGIEPGDIYNQELLTTRLSYSQDGRDVTTLYMDNGYLFFSVEPVEVAVVGDSIDLEIRIYEGPQATIDKVTIAGNDRTHEHVIRRELRTVPGAKFSRSDIIRSQRQLINLGYFNPEALGINTPVNPARGTVDIEYTVEEKPSDQLELSAGWGGRGRGVIGTLGVSFNNFSLRNIFNKEAWSPLPQGDGQRLSLRAQTNGRFFQSYNASFTEPWLGGKKPNALTVAGYFNILQSGVRDTESYQRFGIGGLTVSLGSRLRFPDDNFISTTGLNLQSLKFQTPGNGGGFGFGARGGIFTTDLGEQVSNGQFYNISLSQNITRTTINNPLFPQEGSKISLSVQATLPYSLFRDTEDFFEQSIQERYRFVEYHKWRLDAEWYTTLVGKLVLKASAKFGIVGSYNRSEVGVSPFERFQLGGDGLNNQQTSFYTGTDIIRLRGYEINELSNNLQLLEGGGISPTPTPLYDKLSLELRYPVSLNPNSTIYGLVFAEGGNAWRSARDFNPFDLKRSVGAGLRVFLPMFGILGFDWGIGFDKANENTSFSDLTTFNIILGFEPE